MHRAFRILFTVWAFVIIGLIVFGLTKTKTGDLLTWVISLIGFVFAAGIFRLFLYGVYVLARNRSTQKLSELIGAVK